MEIKRLLTSTLVRSAGLYTLANILTAAVPFLLLPFLTRALTPFEYGLVANFQILVAFLFPFTGLSVQGAIAREYYERERIDFPVYVTNALLLLAVSTVGVIVLMMLFGGAIAGMAEFPVEWLWAVVAVCFSQFLTQIALVLWQVQKKALAYGAFQVGQTILLFAAAIWLVVIEGKGWEGFLLSQVYGKAAFGMVACAVLWKGGWLKLVWNARYMTDMLKFGAPLVPHTFGGWLRASADRLLINKLVGVAENGIYTVAFQITNLITLVESSFNNAWVPWFYEKLKANDAETKRRIVQFTYVYTAAMVFGSILFALALPLVLSFFIGERFGDAQRFLLLLSIGKAIESLYFMTSSYLFYMKKTIVLTVITFLASAAHIMLVYILVRLQGTVGAAQATVISTTIIALLTMAAAARAYPMPWLLRKKERIESA